MMLILTRKPGQVITIAPQPDLHPSTRAADLFHRPIEIVVVQSLGPDVRIGLNADPRLLILRQELVDARDDALRMTLLRQR